MCKRHAVIRGVRIKTAKIEGHHFFLFYQQKEMTCPVCLETYTKEVRFKITCPYCPASACRVCIQRYLLTTYEDPHCIECKRPWNREFIDLNLRSNFRQGPLRKHRAKILMDREKAMLPAMQIFVEATKNLRSLANNRVAVSQTLRVYEVRRVELLREREGMRVKIRHAKTKEDEDAALAELDNNCERYGSNEARLVRIRFDIDNIERTIRRWHNILDGRDAEDNHIVEPREFIQRCPAEGCRGYLSTAYKCGTCAKFSCSECLAVKGDARDAEHTCNEEAKASATMIRRETKACPKCGVRIYKIDGCDQMFCTQETCHTAFSWNTGRIVTGNIHNPHYYEYLRHRNGGELPREAGDIPCGGLPALWGFSREIMAIPAALLSVDTKNLILNIHRCLTDMVDVRLPDFPAHRPANVNKDINIMYLMNELSEEEWRRMLEQRETRFERKREIGQILTTFAHVGAEIIRSFAEFMRSFDNIDLNIGVRMSHIAKMWNETSQQQLEDLRLYTNKSLVEVGKRMSCAIPQIDPTWFYLSPRKEGLHVPVVATAPSAPAPVTSFPVLAPAAPAPATVRPPRAAALRREPPNRFTLGDFANDDVVIID